MNNLAWHIASIPFWILAFFFIAASIAAVPMRGPNETSGDLVGQVIGSLLACGLTLIIAAWLSS